jgi:hypothetical protein
VKVSWVAGSGDGIASFYAWLTVVQIIVTKKAWAHSDKGGVHCLVLI